MNIVECLGLVFRCVISNIKFLNLAFPIIICHENLIGKQVVVNLTEHKLQIKQPYTHRNTKEDYFGSFLDSLTIIYVGLNVYADTLVVFL